MSLSTETPEPDAPPETCAPLAESLFPAEAQADAVHLGRLDEKGDLSRPVGASPPIPNLDLLVSFCNVWPYGFTLARINTRTGWFRYGARTPERAEYVGADGLRLLPGGRVLCVDQVTWGGVSAYCLLSPDLRIEARHELGANLDVHDMTPWRSGFAAAVSARDQVVLVREGRIERVLYESGANADTLHVNGLATHQGRLYASMFGEKVGESWRDAADGRIVDVRSGETAASGVRQPHSPAGRPDGLWVCESATGRVLQFETDGARRVFAQLRGYLRGLLVGSRLVVVGASAVRRRSRHLGVDVPIQRPETHLETSRLYVIDRQTRDVWCRDVGYVGHEIFAVAPAPRGGARLSQQEAFAAMQERVLVASTLR